MERHRPIGWVSSVEWGSPAHTRVITEPKYSVGDNRFCGPAAVSALTGCTVALAETLFQLHRPVTVQHDVRGSTRCFAAQVKGTTTHEVRAVLDTLGFAMSFHDLGARGMSLVKWMSEHQEPNFAYLIDYANHWGVVQDGWFCDNQRGLVRVAKATYRRGIVHAAHIVRRCSVIDFCAVESEYTRRLANSVKFVRAANR